jgi:hypothetical protein
MGGPLWSAIDRGGLPDDIEELPDTGSWVVPLPMLDPTVMGWQTRRFYFGRRADQLFDIQGNAGTTIWVDGRVVGYWAQDSVGAVHLRLQERISTRAGRALETEASRLPASSASSMRCPNSCRFF